MSDGFTAPHLPLGIGVQGNVGAGFPLLMRIGVGAIPEYRGVVAAPPKKFRPPSPRKPKIKDEDSEMLELIEIIVLSDFLQ